MPNLKHIFTIPLLLIYLFINNSFSQEWSEPINISNSEFVDYASDIAITQDNTIHLVWSHKIGSNYTKIFYSNSDDLGNSWSLPLDISMNNEFECGNSHILRDSENQLFVSYEHNLGNPSQTKIYLRTYNGENWSDAIVVTDTMPGSDHSLITIDKEDRLYVFWAYQNYKFYYKHFQNEIWSDVYLPYESGGPFFINECICDSNNNLHCVGSSNSPTLYYENITYYFYDFSIATWNAPDVLTENVLYVGNDIDLDSNDEPNIVWRERTNSSPPYSDGTFYSSLNNNVWSNPELIVEDPWDQRILIDKNNNVNIFNREKTPFGSQLVHYLYYGSLWEGSIIDTSVYLAKSPQISELNDELIVTYAKSHPSGEYSDIWISKSDIFTGIQEKNRRQNSFVNINTYPNPFSLNITLEYTVSSEGMMKIYISSLEGRLVKVLKDDFIIPGNYKEVWDGLKDDGLLVENGLYLVRFQLNDQIITRKIECLN